ncbi:MAG: right-handed parallel beta-helix repeat-containing protein [Planctomycetaceae bacterium]|nr:right-handed parallel beta-helix repeat-containing protein [Planctomycetaceae bacterium]
MSRYWFPCLFLFISYPVLAGEIVFPVAKNAEIQTLQQAQEKVRAFRQANPNTPDDVVIEIAGGDYELEQPLTLGIGDSGTEQSRTIWRAKAGETVRLLGGKILHSWEKVSDSQLLEQWEPGVREKIYQTNLKAEGISGFGAVGKGGAELFFDGKPMQVARYPNEGFIKITGLLNEEPVEIHGAKGDKIGKFHFEDSRVNRWTNEKDAWVHGYWFWDWSEQRHKVRSIDTEKKILEIEPPYHTYGYRLGQWFYGFNLLCEIDQSGEYHLDRDTGILYFYPPSTPAEKESFLSRIDSLFLLTNASHITISNLILEGCRADAVIVRDGKDVFIATSVIRNIGGTAVSISGGFGHGVQGCDIHETGAGGISLSGGDRDTLESAEHFADNNHIHHFARLQRVYQPGISLRGVGNRATHNLIAHAPHMAIGFGGNDHLMEFNEIDDVCYESNDAGAIYTGRNWTMRGNTIRYNYLHDIEGFEKKGCVGVYLDDMFASADIIGNIFLRVSRAAMIGGGRDNSIVNNIFIDCVPSLHIDARALGWAAYHADDWIKEAGEKGTISGIPWNKPPYSEKYPALVNILEDEPKAPKGNVISQNICLRGVWDKSAGFWNMSIEEKARPYLAIENNTVWVTENDQFVGTNPLFADMEHPEKAGFRLQEDSPALQTGFQPIPFEKIGPYQDANRASWPIQKEE